MNEFVFDLKSLEVDGFYLYDGKVIKVTEIIGDFDRLSVRIMDGQSSKVVTYEEIHIDELKEKLSVKDDNQPIKHKVFDKILTVMKNGLIVYLFGPAGTGKNVICKQIADEMGLPFYFANAVTQEFALTGYGDANGNYVETEFFRAFTQGGLFMLDELDASCPEALITLNAALANRYFTFPIIGRVDAHKDFKVIAAGNSCGRGADEVYSGRSVIDGATMDRFKYIKVGYDDRIEYRLANKDSELVGFIHDLRASAKKAGYPLVLSYRSIDGVSKLIDSFTIRECIEMCITKGMDADEVSILHEGLSDKANRFAKALKELTHE